MCNTCMGINSDKCPSCGRSPREVECPKCHGRGYIYWAEHVYTGQETEVTAETYAALPVCAAQAIASGKNYFRTGKDECWTCRGRGVIEEK